MSVLFRGSILTLAFALAFSAGPCHAGESPETLGDEFFAEFLVGTYKVVGRKVNSLETYTGSVTISRQSGVLQMRREIQGRKAAATAEIVRSNVEGAPVLRVTFEEAGANYEGSYIWSSDLDNYARISGVIVKRGEETENPGLECLFIDHSSP